MNVREYCPFHADDDVVGTHVSDEVGWGFRCLRDGHPSPGPFEWVRPPKPAGVDKLDGIAAELGLHEHLPDLLRHHDAVWVEYGVLERAYALARPEDWRFLLDRYSHTAVQAKRYTVSAFLGGALWRLCKHREIAGRLGPATGRWKYNGRVGYFAGFPEPPEANVLTWESTGLGMGYVVGGD